MMIMPLSLILFRERNDFYLQINPKRSHTKFSSYLRDLWDLPKVDRGNQSRRAGNDCWGRFRFHCYGMTMILEEVFKLRSAVY